MTIIEFAQRIIALIESGIISTDGRMDYPFVYSLINTGSAAAKREEFLKSKRIHSSWMLPFVPEFNEAAQISSCYWKFKLPQIIALDSRQTGLGYVGNIDCNSPYRVVENRAKFAAMQKHRMMKNRANTVLITNGYIELYGNAKELSVDGLWFAPEELPSFNIEKSPYPIEASLVPRVEAILAGMNLNMISKIRPDLKQDFVDAPTVVNSQINK